MGLRGMWGQSQAPSAGPAPAGGLGQMNPAQSGFAQPGWAQQWAQTNQRPRSPQGGKPSQQSGSPQRDAYNKHNDALQKRSQPNEPGGGIRRPEDDEM